MYYAVIDEEFCNVVPCARTEQYKLKYELIQIGVVLMDENFNVVSTFNEYIRPEHGYVDAYIRNLTGITQYTVSQSETLENVLDHLKNWLPEDTVMVSWSTSDLHQLKRETEQKNLNSAWLEALYEGWLDCQKEFSDRIEADKVYKLEEAVNMAAIDAEGEFHNGFADAYNTAMIFKKLRTEDDFSMSDKYIKAKEEQESIGFSLGNLLSKLAIA